jgi:hypothetical protein
MSLTTPSPAGSAHTSRLTLLPVLLAAMLSLPFSAAAQNNNHALGSASEVAPRPLQELIQKKREKGLVYVTIPQARVYGEGSGFRAYCSPQIRAINASHKTVEEMLAGIRYKSPSGKYVGSTITRFFRVKVGKEETHYFYSTINADNCEGLTGELEVLRCVYDNGLDCTNDVRSVEYGAVPIQIIKKPKESK